MKSRKCGARIKLGPIQTCFHLPLLPLEAVEDDEWAFPPANLSDTTTFDDRPIDLLHQLSNCTPQREKLATTFRREMERQGLNFVAAGRCTAGGPQLQET